MKNNIDTSQNINTRIEKGVTALAAQYKGDKAFRADITTTLDEQEQKSQYQVGVLVENLLASYDLPIILGGNASSIKEVN